MDSLWRPSVSSRGVAREKIITGGILALDDAQLGHAQQDAEVADNGKLVQCSTAHGGEYGS